MFWILFFSGYALFTAVLIGYSTHVALTCRNAERRADAYKVLKLIWGGTTGTTSLVALAIRLHETGVL